MILPALLLLAAPQAPGWTPLPLPSLSRPRSVVPTPDVLDTGAHLTLSRSSPSRGASSSAPLPINALLDLLEGQARRLDMDLRIRRPAPPLLVRGDPRAVSAAREVLSALDSAGAARRIRIEAWLLSEAVSGACTLGADDAAGLRLNGPPTFTAEVEPGQLVALGERREDAFLARFDVEVAANSGAASPVVGHAHVGETVHLRCWRAERGRALVVEGMLDLAAVESNEFLDTGLPELGRLQQPHVRFVQVAFGGRIESGGVLRVVLEGVAPDGGGRSLLLRASTEPDPSGDAWRVRDLALIDRECTELPMPWPGGGHGLPEVEGHRPALEALPAAAVWGEVERELTRAGGGRAPLLAYAPGILVGPAEPAALWQEVDALGDAAERMRLRTAELSVGYGAFRARLPVCASSPVRVHFGVERPVLGDYRLEIAPDTWMAAPRVSRSVDGLCMQGLFDAATFDGAAWVATSEPGLRAGPGDTAQGVLELARRGFATGAVNAVAGQPFELPLLRDAEGADDGRLRIELSRLD